MYKNLSSHFEPWFAQQNALQDLVCASQQEDDEEDEKKEPYLLCLSC